MSGRPMLHQTDLFRPPIDPDDHWDLACVYALAAREDISLEGILLDYPPTRFPGRDPDVTAVAQLNYLTGMAVPCAVGSSVPFVPTNDGIHGLSRRDRTGADLVLAFLDTIPTPGVINIVGSCRDVALALSLNRELFAEKCAGIYLNAGTGCPDPALVAKPEYNVTLNPEAYAAIFDAPCPLYWLPCFEGKADAYKTETREYATWYRFQQEDVLPSLSPVLRGYFIASLEGRLDTRYLRYVVDPESESFSPYTVRSHRDMWCTAGFLHAAGYAITRDGEIVSVEEADDRTVCEFVAIDVSCDERGATRWRLDGASRDRYIFRVRDLESYAPAVTKAMTTLLLEL